MLPWRDVIEHARSHTCLVAAGPPLDTDDWSEDEAKKNLLRTHTTAVSSRMLYALAQQEEFTPKKYFSIDRVFRNETMDATHLAEFHQIEGERRWRWGAVGCWACAGCVCVCVCARVSVWVLIVYCRLWVVSVNTPPPLPPPVPSNSSC